MIDQDQLDSDAEATVGLLKTSIPRFEPRVEYDLKHGCWSIELPLPLSADYQFTLHGEVGGERQIGARPVRSEGQKKGRLFWYSAMEMADFRDDASKLEMLFHRELKHLLECPTRIVEKMGVMWLSYRADYQTEAGWKRLRGGASYLRLGLGVPFVGRKHTYTSPPVARSAER